MFKIKSSISNLKDLASGTYREPTLFSWFSRFDGLWNEHGNNQVQSAEKVKQRKNIERDV